MTVFIIVAVGLQIAFDVVVARAIVTMWTLWKEQTAVNTSMLDVLSPRERP